jgi:putative hydrolase of the HAD superfamily
MVTELEIGDVSWQELLDDYETQFQFHCIPFDFLFEVLNILKQQEYLLGIITNGLGKFQTRSIEGLKIKDYFDVILISEIEKVRKPQPEIFQRAIDRLGVSASNSVFIGDHPEADILGAKNVNMKTIWKHNSHWQQSESADAIIDQLSEIPPIVEQFKYDRQYCRLL